VPTVVGTIIGALITHLAAKARGREEHERSIDLLVMEDERRSAQGALSAVREIGTAINAGSVTSYAALYNQWLDHVVPPARLIRSEEPDARVHAGAYVLFLATIVPEEFVIYSAGRGADDVEEFLESWLRREDPPPAHLPLTEEIRRW
jgi:hypothetical protein